MQASQLEIDCVKDGMLMLLIRAVFPQLKSTKGIKAAASLF